MSCPVCTDPQKLDQKSNDWEVGLFMAKYSYEFKKKVVDAYLNGEGGYSHLAETYGIAAWSNIKKWVLAYSKMGDKGLIRSRKKESFSFEYKLHVVELYLSSEVSYQDLALQERINNPAQIAKWVNDFRIAGPDALRPKKKGRKKSLESNNKNNPKLLCSDTINCTPPVDTTAEHVKQLENELLKLRIENAYLKELRRLRLEEETLLKKQREISTASEDPLN